MERRISQPTGKWLLAIAVTAVALSAAFKIIEGDIWWHIRAGQWIWEHGGLPAHDPFSHTSAGPWRNSDWLSQLFFFALDRLGGAHALVWGKVLLVGLLALCLVAVPAVSAGARALSLCLCFLCLHMRLLVMPELFSFLFFVGLMKFLGWVENRRPGPWLLVLPVVVAIWSNFHRAAALGLLLEAAALAAWAIDRERRKRLPWLAVAWLLSLPALAANPGGWYTLSSVFDVAGSDVLRAYIAEWAPFSLALPWPSLKIFLGATMVWLAGWLAFSRRADFPFWLCAGTVALGFYSVRLVPFAALALFAPISQWMDKALAWAEKATAGMVRAVLWESLAVATGLASLLAFYVANYPLAAYGSGIAEWLVPLDAAKFLRENPPPGKMWNPLNPSGYLLYALSPDIKVSIDGRADTVYGWEYYRQCLQAPHDADLLYEQIERWDISFVVMELQSPEPAGYRRLARDPQWTLVFLDDHWAIMVKRTPVSEWYLSRVGYRVLRPAGELAHVLEAVDEKMHREFAEDVFENLQRAPNSIRAHVLAAVVYRRLGWQADFLREKALLERLAARRGIENNFF